MVKRGPKARRGPKAKSSTSRNKLPKAKVPAQCRFCDKWLSDRHSRLVHENAVHTKLRRFACKLCKKEFGSHSSASRCLRRHRAKAVRRSQQQAAAPTASPLPNPLVNQTASSFPSTNEAGPSSAFHATGSSFSSRPAYLPLNDPPGTAGPSSNAGPGHFLLNLPSTGYLPSLPLPSANNQEGGETVFSEEFFGDHIQFS